MAGLTKQQQRIKEALLGYTNTVSFDNITRFKLLPGSKDIYPFAVSNINSWFEHPPTLGEFVKDQAGNHMKIIRLDNEIHFKLL